jgi:hypothetical protein
MVSLSLDLTGLVAGQQANPNDYLLPLGELQGYLESTCEASQTFDALLAGSGSLDASALVQLNTTSKTFVLPRMTSAQQSAILSPATGLIIYNITLGQLEYYSGSTWQGLLKVIFKDGARATTPTPINISTATPTIIGWSAENYDSNGLHDNFTNNSRITCQVAGKYILSAQIKMNTAISNSILIELLLNGTTVIAAQAQAGILGVPPYLNLATVYNFNQGDYVQVRLSHTSGITEDIDSGSACHFSAQIQLQ